MQPLKNKQREDCKCRTDAAAVKWRAVASSERFPELKKKKTLGTAEIMDHELVLHCMVVLSQTGEGHSLQSSNPQFAPSIWGALWQIDFFNALF